ncbi:hypothetical protein CCACVL1_05040 [Corchorus capsularis]|uniref:Uncharacterized protein n=1 Tax=Corchorus capsularis TaxID=210143 RepID=A0A1R3JNA1_COCAP|nr:hypothetical protein CCACVL1_05040 [Corchorus capsularis]
MAQESKEQNGKETLRTAELSRLKSRR